MNGLHNGVNEPRRKTRNALPPSSGRNSNKTTKRAIQLFDGSLLCRQGSGLD